MQRQLQLFILTCVSLLARAPAKSDTAPRIACIWVLPGAPNWPYSFDLVAYTLMAHDMQWGLDLHVLTPSIPSTYLGNGEKAQWPFLQNVYFHTMTNSNWHQRIYDRLGQNISYPLNNKKKVADFKPMFGQLFPDIITMDKYDYWVYGDYDGFFGSYDAVLNYDRLPMYEVVSGFTQKYYPNDPVDFARTSHYVLGSWTMLRNSLKMNALFKRSVNYKTVIRDEKKQYSFDENTDSDAVGKESFHDVIKKSIDVTRCCYDETQPSVRVNKQYKIVMDMRGDYIRDGVQFKFKWEKNKPVSFSIDGHIGNKMLYVNGTTQGLFLHFLQWKYIRPHLFHTALKKFIGSIVALEGGYMSVDCFETTVHAKNIETTDLLYTYDLCSPSPPVNILNS